MKNKVASLVSKTTKKAIKSITDAWTNVAQGINVQGIDKTIDSYSLWQATRRVEADNLYASDDNAAKIVDIVPDDMIKEGVTWKISKADGSNDGQVAKSLNNEFDRLCVWSKFNWGLKMANLHGGSCIIISVDDGLTLDQPLNISRVRKINALHVVDRWSLHIFPGDIINDIRDPMFGRPRYYNFNSSDLPGIDATFYRVHYSRVIRFDGVKLPNDLFIKNNYWDDSVFGKSFRAIANYGTSHSSIVTTIAEINQPVYKLSGLTEAIAQDEEELVVNKLNFINLMRSSLRAIVLDQEDEFDFKQVAVNGVADLFNIVKERLIAAANIPHSRFMGESPGASLGESGGAQLKDYYDRVSREQKLRLTEPIDRIVELIFSQTQLGLRKPDYWSFIFNPLYSEPQETIIRTRQMQAQIDQVYMQSGVYDSYEVANSRFSNGDYSFETIIENRDDDVGMIGFEPEEEEDDKPVEDETESSGVA